MKCIECNQNVNKIVKVLGDEETQFCLKCWNQRPETYRNIMKTEIVEFNPVYSKDEKYEVGLDAEVILTKIKVEKLEGSIRLLKEENKKKDERIETLELKVEGLEAQLKRLNEIEKLLFNQEQQAQTIQPPK